MTNKISRNDPCPCGSGKKYKKCCLPKQSMDPMRADPAWMHLRETEGIVADYHLERYIHQELPEVILRVAWGDLIENDLPEAMDQELLFTRFFIPWFLFSWIPDDDFGVEQFDPKKTIAQNYLKVHADQLNSDEKAFIEAMDDTYYSYYSVLEVEFEKSLVVKDILLGTTHKIKEKQGTHALKRGDVVFGRILTFNGQSIFVGMAPFIIPARYHLDLIEYRNWLIEENDQKELNASSLHDKFAMDLNDYFFETMEERFNKPLPTLINTDGDLIQFTQSHFALMIDPEEVVHKLLPLTLSKNAQEFLDEAKRDSSGNIKKVRIPWIIKGNKKHKDWETTIMGNIVLEKGNLILETNSKKRDAQGTKLLNRYLGDAIQFRETRVESVERALERAPKKQATSRKEKELLQSPEVQRELEKMAKAHWEFWFDEPIPALNHQTPREAAKTPEGREKLEALLLQYERYDQTSKIPNAFKADIQYLKKELALD